MRPDMKKVLCERPRAGGTITYHDIRAKWRNADYDDLPAKEGMRKPYGYEGKSLTDLIGPLYRFFQSRVGHKYDDVWSEVCANLKGGGTVNDHLKDHARDFVETNTVVVDGKVMVQGFRRYGGDLREPDGLYVDPRDGRIHRAPDRPKYRNNIATLDGGSYYVPQEDGVYEPYEHRYWRNKDVARYGRKIIGAEEECVRVNGIWYWVVFGTVPNKTFRSYLPDGSFTEHLVNFTHEDFITGEKRKPGERCRVGKRQMSSRDLRKHGLANAANDD